jgi:hypothetical protein
MKEKLQMVDDDQVENVGIMSGFMDEIDELLEEISGEEQEEGDDADMARMMARTPDSPEILMNNLRGDMRSIDARREELADLVGFREAEETPEGVLALLQPILAQQAAPCYAYAYACTYATGHASSDGRNGATSYACGSCTCDGWSWRLANGSRDDFWNVSGWSRPEF